ncbi:MAG: hypothetical protein ACMUJM_20030 [bacterium]
MNLDFIQIGFQKCGTTFLFKNVYLQNPEIACIQVAQFRILDELLLRKLILPDGLEYYSQYIKAGGLLSLEDFVYSFLTNPHLEGHYIDWYPLIAYLYKVFGKENVLVCVYEHLKEDPQMIADTIFNFLGTRNYPISWPVVNPSLSKQALYVKRILNHLVRYDCGSSSYSFCEDFKFGIRPKDPKVFYRIKYLYKSLSNRLCSTIDDFFGLSEKITLNKNTLIKIHRRYLENNKKLANILNIDLSKYKYI